MNEQFTRTETLIGAECLNKLKNSRVAVFGIGGVGGFTTEALARAGVGALDLIDKDTVDITNLNRQIVALHSTIGRPKVAVMKERILDIHPEADVREHQMFYLPETADQLNLQDYDYIVDAIDNVTAKIELISRAQQLGIPVISSMGTGNKLDPTLFEIAKIENTSVCPLAKVMRKELRKRGITEIKVLYSKEEPRKQNGQRVPASISFVPSVAGLIIAGEVVKDLISGTKKKEKQG